MRFRLVSFCLLALLVVGLSSCNLPRPSSAASSGRQDAATAAAETVQALGTQLVGGTVPAPVSA
ncbi:MAG TPA: hypothetical protein VF813_00705, partial [Anaerolineaceae bacterium]